jgi:hypothetical protein
MIPRTIGKHTTRTRMVTYRYGRYSTYSGTVRTTHVARSQKERRDKRTGKGEREKGGGGKGEKRDKRKPVLFVRPESSSLLCEAKPSPYSEPPDPRNTFTLLIRTTP